MSSKQKSRAVSSSSTVPTPEMIRSDSQRHSKYAGVYFLYLLDRIFRSWSFYATVGIYTLFVCTILLIVPTVLHTDPLFLWASTSSEMNVHAFHLIILSVVMASLCITIFKANQSDGTNLLIASKPLRRRCLILVSYLTILLIIAIIIVLNIVLALFCLLNKNFDQEKMPALIGSLMCGIGINCLFFTSISVIACLLSKSSILVCVISCAIANVFTSSSAVIVTVDKTPMQIIQNDLNLEMNTYAFCAGDDRSPSDLKKYATIKNSSDKKTYDPIAIWQKTIKKTGTYSQYYNLGKQLSDLYVLPNLNTNKLSNDGVNERWEFFPESVLKDNFFHRPITFYSLIQKQGFEEVRVNFLGNKLNNISMFNNFINGLKWEDVCSFFRWSTNSVAFLSLRDKGFWLANESFITSASEQEKMHSFLTHDYSLKQLAIDNYEVELMDDQGKITKYDLHDLHQNARNFCEGKTNVTPLNYLTHLVNSLKVIRELNGKEDEEMKPEKFIEKMSLKLLWTAKLHLLLCQQVQQWQEEKLKINVNNASSSNEIMKLLKDQNKWTADDNKYISSLIGQNVKITSDEDDENDSWGYEHLNFVNDLSCEAYGYLTNYQITKIDNKLKFLLAWIVISVFFFLMSAVVYRKIDIK